jgi:hypothetical protein
VATVLTLDRVADLTAGEAAAVRALTLAVYPPDQFADWPGRAVEWSTPEWCIRIRERAELVSYAGVYLRAGFWDGRASVIGGLGNVKTHPAARGRGLAGRAIGRAVEFFTEHQAEFGLLVCAPGLVGYYAGLGWLGFAGRLLVRQGAAVTEFTLNGAMTVGVRSAAPVAGTIDLCGPPW